MKQHWIKLRDRIDALSLRERVAVFGASTAALVFVGYSLALEPLMIRRDLLKDQAAQQMTTVNALDIEIGALIQAHSADPDVANRALLAQRDEELRQLQESLQSLQTGLVAPEQMAPLLENMLRTHGRLKLAGLQTLAPVGINDPAAAAVPPAPVAAAAPAPGAAAPGLPADVVAAAPLAAGVLASPNAAAAAPAAGTPAAGTPGPAPLLYRHGVELVVRGNYLDMVSYLGALEAMPVQLIWGRADLVVEDYPQARLTLTVYTLSLDKQWMKL